MKPVRVVEDIVRPKAIPGSGAPKATFGDIKNAARAASKSSSAKVPFFIWSTVILAELVFAMSIATELIPRSSTLLLSDQGTPSNAVESVSRETAIARDVVVPLSSASTPNAPNLNELPEITPGLLPIIPVPPFKATSTAATSSKKTVAPPSKPKPALIPAPTPTAVTARSILDATTFSVRERYDGPYTVAFVTNAGTYGTLLWDLGTTALTAGGSLPSFSITFSCDPPPNMPAPDALDQNPTFKIKTSFTCDINLTPTSGNNRQTQSKQFSFTTGSGQLVVTLPSYMSALLKDNASFGGFIFRNDNTEPTTITGLDIDVSYKGLNVADGFLILRFQDPTTERSLAEYHLENLVADPSRPYAHAGTNIHIPLSLTIGAANQKMLSVNILGVRKLGIYGVDPTVAVTLRKVTTDQDLNRVVLDSAKIVWSCVIPLGAYDPNATSGPYATGQACRE